MDFDLYEVLGLNIDCTSDDIKKAYRKLSKSHHPDKGGDPAEFLKIQVAYEVLFNKESRAKYDRTGEVDNNSVPLKTAGINIMLGLWDQLLGYNCNMGISDINLVDGFIIKLSDMKKEGKENIKKLKKIIMTLKKIEDSIKYKGEGNNLLKSFASDKISQINTQINVVSRRLDELSEAEKIIEDYDYVYAWDEDEDEKTSEYGKLRTKLLSTIMDDVGMKDEPNAKIKHEWSRYSN